MQIRRRIYCIVLQYLAKRLPSDSLCRIPLTSCLSCIIKQYDASMGIKFTLLMFVRDLDPVVQSGFRFSRTRLQGLCKARMFQRITLVVYGTCIVYSESVICDVRYLYINFGGLQ